MEINDLTSSEWKNWFDSICEKYAKYKEQEAFENAKKDKLIEEAVLIMHPKHRHIIMESELSKATIVWSDVVEEDKAYMVVDEEVKETIRKNIGEYRWND